jgi:hypothetical protein
VSHSARAALIRFSDERDVPAGRHATTYAASVRTKSITISPGLRAT